MYNIITKSSTIFQFTKANGARPKNHPCYLLTVTLNHELPDDIQANERQAYNCCLGRTFPVLASYWPRGKIEDN
jgi:hypothetical protein